MIRKQATVVNLGVLADVTTGDEGHKDSVIGWATLPSGARLNGIWYKIKALAMSDVAVEKAVTLGITAYIFPLTDPDTQDADPNTTWDRLVPKAQVMDTTMVDLDTAGAQDDATFAWTQLNFNEMFEIAMPKKLFDWHDLVTVLDPPSFLPGTTDKYRPAIMKSGRIKSKYFSRTPSVVMFAASNTEWPDDLNVFTGALQEWSPDTAEKWAMLQYPELLIEEAYKAGVGMTTSDTTVQLLLLVEWLKQVYSDNTDQVNSQSMNFFSRFTYDVTFKDFGVKQPVTGR